MYSSIGRLPWNEFWEVLSRSPSGALLGQHDDLSARLVLLHAAMGLSDLVRTNVEYVGYIVRGLREHGVAAEYIANVKAIAIVNNPTIAAALNAL